MTPGRFAIRYSPVWRVVLGLFGLGPRFSWVELSGDALEVRLGWGFGTRVPRSSIASVARLDRNLWYTAGAHTNLRGRWLVNGSGHGIMVVEVDPPARGRSVGFPIHPKTITVSLEDPDGFLAAVRAPQTAPWEGPA